MNYLGKTYKNLNTEEVVRVIGSDGSKGKENLTIAYLYSATNKKPFGSSIKDFERMIRFYWEEVK